MKPIEADDLRVGMVVTVLRNNPYKDWEQAAPSENNPLGIGVIQTTKEDNSYVGSIYIVEDVSYPFVVIRKICNSAGHAESTRASVTVYGRQWAHVNRSYAKALSPSTNWEGMDLYESQSNIDDNE